MGYKKYDTSTLEENDRRRIESMKKYINSLNLNKPFFTDLPEAYNPVDPDHPELGNVQARAGIGQGKLDQPRSGRGVYNKLGNVQARAGIGQGKLDQPRSGRGVYNSNVIQHKDGTQSRVWSSGVYCAGGQHQSPRLREAPLEPVQPLTTLDRMLQVGKAIGVIR